MSFDVNGSRSMDVGVDLGVSKSMTIFLIIMCISIMLTIVCCVYEYQHGRLFSKSVHTSRPELNRTCSRVQIPRECYNLSENRYCNRCGLDRWYVSCVCDSGADTCQLEIITNVGDHDLSLKLDNDLDILSLFIPS